MPAGTRPLSVALVCPYDLSRPGGVQGQVEGLARALRRAGHRAAVFAPGSPPGWSAPGSYVIGRSVRVRANGSVAPVCLSPWGAGRAVRAAQAWGPDVVHLHEPLAPVAGYGFLLGHRWPTVATFHRAGDSPGYRLVRPAAAWLRGRIDVSCAVSEAARDTAGDILGGTYDVLFNGVETGRFAGVRPAPSAVPAVVFLGRHEPRKGLGILLEAFTEVRQPAVLLVAGDGPATADLKRRYPESSRVHWLGVVSDEAVASLLAGAAVLCAPSLGGESFGVVLLEAMAAGSAVVASDIPGYRAAAGGHAALVTPGDAGALAGALEGVLASPPSPAARSAAVAHAEGWSMDRLAACYVERYRAVVGRSPTRSSVTA